MKARASTLLAWIACTSIAVACGGSGPGDLNGGPGSQGGSSNGGSSNGGGQLGSGGTQSSGACSPAGATRACCTTGTQTCDGSGEFHSWGPCLDQSGAPLSCPATGGGGSEDAGGPGTGGGGSEDAGGPGTGGGGFEDAAMPALCTNDQINNEPEILVGYAPATGQTVGANGQIKVWVNDENPPIIAPNEKIDPTTGAITTPGDRTAKAPDGYLWEPALYIAPQTAENGGTPHFPSHIKGWFDNTPGGGGPGIQIPNMDPVPPGSQLAESFTGEDIWDVSSLGLGPGTYIGEFVIHDGDEDRAVGCVTIVIQ